MAQKSNQRTSYKTSYRGFEGINLQKTHSGDESVALLENFKISDDGSLRKRSGWKHVCEIPSGFITSIHSVCNGKEIYYLLCKTAIVKYDPTDQSAKTILEIPTCSSAHFFEYLGKIYLFTDTGRYEISDNGAKKADFYIPLYGKDWPSSYAGEIYEPVNLLCDKVAISYKLVAPAHGFLSLGDLNVSSIDALYRNGTLLSTDKYRYDEDFGKISLSEHEENDELIAVLSIIHDEKSQEQQASLLGATSALAFYELNNHSLLFWGDKSSNRVFYSKTAPKDSLELTRKCVSSVGSIYVPLDSFFTVDKATSRVNAIIRHYDRVLIMTDSSTWMTDLQQLGSEEFLLKNINSSLGCNVANGAVRMNNSIISITNGKAYCWRSNTDELNECNAYVISDPVQELIDADFFKNALIKANYNFGEVWFHNPSSAITWVYNVTRSAWYKYTGFSAPEFLNSNDDTAFVDSNFVSRFDDRYMNDQKNEITSIFKSGNLEFDSIKYKKMRLVVLRGEFTGGELIITLSFDNGKELSYSFSPIGNHFVLPLRMRSGSFKSVSVQLTANGIGKQIIHSMELYAK